jgi:hypothetical protein
MTTVAIFAAFALIAAALYILLSLLIKRMDAHYDRNSADFRRKDFG